MEYLLGSLVTLLVIFVGNRVIRKNAEGLSPAGIFYTQSVIHSTLMPILPTNKELRSVAFKKTQASEFYNKTSLRVLFLEDKAYWIKENTFYMADVVDGVVDENTTSKVDIMGMDTVQLKEMSFIVDKLTEGIDDENRYSGK